MNSISPEFLKQLANQAAEIEDQTEVQTSYEYETPPAGPTVGRFVEYVELGKQPRKAFAGKEKKEAEELRLVFELNSPQHISKNEDGTPRVNRLTLRVFKSLNDKANFKKLFNAMRYGRDDIKHMAQMVGDAFLMTIVHNTVAGKDGGKGQTYANLRESTEGAPWLIGAPVKVDAIAGTQERYPVPEAVSPLKVFIWELPNKECWDSLFIDGTRERKNADGTTTMESKNFLQEKILAAKNFVGSPVEALLGQIGGLPTTEPKADPLAAAAILAAEQPKTAPVVMTAPTAPSEAPSPELVALLVQGVPLEEAKKQLAAKADPAPEPAPVDPRVAALKAAGLTDEQIAAALNVAPSAPAEAPKAAKKGGGKKAAAQAETPAQAPASPPQTVAAALASLNLTA